MVKEVEAKGEFDLETLELEVDKKMMIRGFLIKKKEA